MLNQLVQKAIDGDGDSFYELIKMKKEHIYKIAYSYAHNQDDALDVVHDVYKLITLDDSAVRFNIVFNQPVNFTVEEYENPGQVVINLSEDNSKSNVTPIYSLRTKSYPFGEEFGILEEVLYEFEELKVLKDSDGTFLFEIGQFSSKEEADLRLKEAVDKIGDSVKLHVEEREATAVPKAIGE